MILPFENYERGGMSDGNVVWQAFFVHMIDQDSFDWEANAEEVAIVGRYMDLDILKKYNEDGRNGEYSSYYDSYWQMPGFYNDKYRAATEHMGEAGSLDNIKAAVTKIILTQPGVFIRSRIRALRVAFWPHDTSGLWMPFYMTLIMIIYALMKKRPVLLLLSLGVIAHIMITALLMPASYEKYFYELYLYGYVFGGITVIELLTRERAALQRDA